jgi:hypothetical protein
VQHTVYAAFPSPRFVQTIHVQHVNGVPNLAISSRSVSWAFIVPVLREQRLQRGTGPIK